MEERLELDIDEALRGIDRVEEALTGAATSFKVALADALDLLGTVAVGEVDASSVTTAIDTAVEAADTEPAIEADASGVTTAIDDAVAGADAEVPVDADATAVTAEIDAAVEGADSTVEVDAITEAVTQQIEDAVSEADATVEVEADTSSAEAAITDLGDTAADAGSGVGGLSLGLGQLSAAGDAATGSLAGLQGGLAATHPVAGAAAVGVASVAAAAGTLFKQALDSDTAQRRFNEALGDMAERVNGIHVDGFADDLEQLAERAGSSDEAMKLAAARIADLGRSAGASQESIATTAENILLLATRATVLNPTLGDAGDVADRMTNAFARGGRATQAFGISLTAAEITARALQDTGKAAAEELTNYEKSAAGAAIVTERLGASLQSDIVSGAQGTEIQLRSLREEFGNTLEEFGKPLLEPVIEAIREGQPILLDLAQTFGTLAADALPLVISGLRVLGPAFDVAATLASALSVPLRLVADVLNAIPAPVLTALATFTALRFGFDRLAVGAFNLVGTASSGLRAIPGLLAGMVTPMGAVTVGVGILAAAWADHAKKQAESNRRVAEGAKAFEDEAQAITDAVAVIAEEAIPTNQEDDIRRLGLTFKEVGELARGGQAGFREFLDTMVEGGQITRAVADAFIETGASAGRLVADQDALGLHTENLSKQNLGLVDTFRSLSGETQESAEAALTHLANTDQLTSAQRELVEAVLASTSGNIDYVAVLEEVKPTSEDAAGGADDLTGALGEQAGQAELTEEALGTLLDAIMGFVNSTVAAETANLRFTDSLTDVEAKTRALAEATRQHGAASEEAKTAQRDLDDAVRSSRDAAITAAEAAVRLAIDTGKVQEGSAGAADQFAIYRDTLQSAADRASGPVRDALNGLIAQIDATKAAGDIQLQIDADTARAEAALRSLQVKLDALNRGIVGVTVAGHFMAGGTAFGGTTGQFVEVGERGRELAFVAPGTSMTVVPNNITEQLLAGLGGIGGGGVTVNVYEVASDPRATAFAVATTLGDEAVR